MDKQAWVLLGIILTLIGILGTCSFLDTKVLAQGLPDIRAIASRDPQLVLAMMFEGEGGGENDAKAMIGVLNNRRARFGGSLLHTAMSFASPIRYNVPATDRRAAVRRRQWPGILHYRPWARELARAALAGEEIGDPCKGRAFDWGSDHDTRHYTHLALDCGGTANIYLPYTQWRAGRRVLPPEIQRRVLPAYVARGGRL